MCLIVHFPFPDVAIHFVLSYGVYQSKRVCYARLCSDMLDFIKSNPRITDNSGIVTTIY